MKQNRSFRPAGYVLRAGSTGVGALFASVADSYPNHVALVDGSRSVTYRQLDERSDLLRNRLVGQGINTGDRVAILARNCLEYIELELAAAKGGLIVAALNWRLSERELAHCINLVDPALIVAQPAYFEVLERLSIARCPIWQIDDDWEEHLQRNNILTDVAKQIDAEDGLVILYTSGTTGMPKGALISHRAMIARAAVFTTDIGLAPQSNFVAWAPLFHMASTDHSLATLMRGGTVFVVDGYQPDRLIELLETHEQGWFVLMPGMVGEFAEKCRGAGLVVKGITACGAMADLVPRDEIAAVTRALNAPYVNSFGATETGLPPATGNFIAIGEAPKALPKRQSTMVELRLVNSEDNDVPIGEPGEVALRGPTLFSGYWNAEETNAQDFRNGWFHMGDVMRRNRDGTLEYVDRVKYLIKSGGENIYPAEIEQVLKSYSDVKEVVVVRKTDRKWGEVPIAFVVASDENLTEQYLTARIDDQLASYKKPKQIIFITDAELPRSTTGKIQRHELEKRLV